MNEKSSGFILMESIVVIAILVIIVVVIASRLAGFISKAQEGVCATNLKSVEIMYTSFIDENDIDHKDSIFNQFIINNFDKICPVGGFISYEYGKVKCSIHCSECDEYEEKEPVDKVPWLKIGYDVKNTKSEYC